MGQFVSKVLSVAYHRNGVGGNGFYVVLFKEGRGKKASRKVGVVFCERGNVAVFDVDLLAAENIKFGENSWRGDDYEPELRQAVYDYSAANGEVAPDEAHDLKHGEGCGCNQR